MYVDQCYQKENFISQELHINMPSGENVGPPYVFASKSVSESKDKESYIQQKINKLSNERREYSVCKFSEISYLKKTYMKLAEAYADTSVLIRILVGLLIISMAVIDVVVSLIGACKLYLMNKISDNRPDAIFLSYYSKGNEINYNGVAHRNNKYIKCNSLAYWWVSKKKPNFDDINSPEKIRNNHEIHGESKLNEDYYFHCPAVAFYFEINQFPEVLSKVAVTLKEGEEQRYRLESCNHAMGIAIKKRQNNIIVNYYDPNDTLRHKTIIVSSEDDLKTLSCNDFFSSETKKSSFPDDYKICCLASLDTKIYQFDCRIECLARQSYALLYFLNLHGHYGHASTLSCFNGVEKNITSKMFLGNYDVVQSPLFAALLYGHAEAAKAYIEDVFSGDLNQDERKILLLGKSNLNNSALAVAMYLGHYKAVKIYCEAILSSDMNQSEKECFIEGKMASGSGLHVAFSRRQYKVIKVYMEAILKSGLSDERKERLLLGENECGIPVFRIICINGYTKSAKVYHDIISSSKLSQDVKERLLLE
ncbi:MAG: ShET2/EspL2 family type III secretion system effector toxin [Endozoicomonadaceae bacterium]|nr:ShET2/EspL2 family type III secretion system effector toxin [Endozoicomonadaceae bacterium]